MRLATIIVFLAITLLVPFFIWGEELEALFSGSDVLAQYGGWAWLVGMGLLMLDLLLPIPGTAVMAGLGYIYGAVLGGVIASAGSVLSGLLAYWLCRGMGHKVACRIAGAEELKRGEEMFARSGGWIVALSRWLPLLPEVIACVAGMVRMPFGRFFIALICGSVPLGFAFAFVGSRGVEHPALALGASILLPPLLWYVAGKRLRKEKRQGTD